MRDKIRRAIVDSYPYHMSEFHAEDIMKAILALEVPGRGAISATCEHYCRPTCSPENCMDGIERIKPSSSECHKRKPFIIADLIGGDK